MTTRIIASPLDFEVSHVAYNTPHTIMAATDGRTTIAIWNKEGESKRWAFASSIEAQGLKATCITLSAPEFGNILCIGTSDGFVCVWTHAPDGTWRPRARLSASSHAATAASFAPRHMGPLVALSFADGYVRTFVASAPLNAASWNLHSEFLVNETGASCTCLTWKDPSSSDTLSNAISKTSIEVGEPKSSPTHRVLPPLLAVGTSAGTAHVLMFHQAFMRWYHVADLEDGNDGDEHARNKEVSAIAWAPTLGRPIDIIAVATGTRVVLWSLGGDADSPTVKRLTVLDHGDEVWQLEWNMTGTWLAASTEAGEVCMWRPDLAGEWVQWNKIVEGDGGVDVAER